MSTEWTPERRAKRAADIRQVAPWTRSTGPTSSGGKAICACNALKHGMRSREAQVLKQAVAALIVGAGK
ncbi:hypothetical protein KVP09_11510 [Alcaligenaceae bacterium CGII-47]|nr:hypothetical protein [Alcaligenaceae bacterium CGII-47]